MTSSAHENVTLLIENSKVLHSIGRLTERRKKTSQYGMTTSRGCVYDCARLLTHVDTTESELVARTVVHFGHPVAPQIQLFALARRDSKPETQPVLAVAFAKHCIAAQVLRPTSSRTLDKPSAEPILHVHTFIPVSQNEGRAVDPKRVEDEVITCLNIVALEDQTLVAGGSTVTVSEKDESSPTRVLLRGILSGNDNLNIAVVVGTNTNRLVSIELLMKRKTWKIQKQTDLPDDDYLFEILPIDNHRTSTTPKHSSESCVSFYPQGGTTSLTMFRLTTVGTHAVYLYIVYGDGTIVRLHHAGVFASVWKRISERGLSIDGVLGKAALLRYHVQLPPNESALTIVPLPKFYPSLVSPLVTLSSLENLGRESSTVSPDDSMEAFVYGSQVSSDHFPVAVFYSSEIQCIRSDDHLSKLQSSSSDRKVLGSMVGGTKALVSGMIGALKWGFSSNVVEENSSIRQENEATQESEFANTPFPSLWTPPVKLYAGNEFHDAPRRIEFCVVDPGGRFAAACDNLGRVLLFDLPTKQLIRLWKGYRSGRCCWMQVPLDHNKISLQLMIHSGHRHVVEVWSTESFARVTAVQVGRDARIVPCTMWSQASLQSTSFLLHSSIAGVPDNMIEAVEDLQEKSLYVAPTDSGDTVSAGSARIATLRLQHLQQLLSVSNVDFSTEDVYKTLTDIQLGDLAIALDLITSSPIIEEKLGGGSYEFHKTSVDYCNMRLHEGLATCDTEARLNPHIKALSEKVQYHMQISKVFDTLHKYELTVVKSEGDLTQTPDFRWGVEAMGWLQTYVKCIEVAIDDIPEKIPRTALRLSKLFSSCQFEATSVGSEDMKICFSESSRTRREILVHVLRPLLGDIFSLNVVYTVFGALGTRHDTEYLLQCFGEWFMTLSQDDIKRGLLSPNRPMTRFLRDLATRALESWGDIHGGIVLGTLHSFCRKSSDLMRSFILAGLCREAAAKASSNIEKSSYGKVSSRKVIEDWDRLLRQLRVCLLVFLRLGGTFHAPLSIELVDEGDVFSVYEWIARDELFMSHDQEEISLLEQACAISSHSFDPSQPESDGPARLKVLQNACVASKISDEERMEYLVDFDDDDRFGALLLFLKSHNNPPLLACHRALLLSLEWIHDPKDLNHLQNSYTALKAVTGDANNFLIAAISLEIWQRCSMVFRVQLFGWDEIQGISEDKFSHLLQNKDWFLPFGRIALKFLRVLRSTDCDINSAQNFATPTENKSTWPLVRPDLALSRVVGRLFAVDKSALDTHCVVICALLVSSNVNALVKCVPSIYDCFLPTSLSKPFSSDSNAAFLRSAFVEDAVVNRAKLWPDVAMEHFNLQEIETLAHVWVIDPKSVRSQFLLAMYELEKDHCVDDLLTRSLSQIDSRMFVEHGVDIACRRLHEFLSGKRMSSTDRRNIMGVLDADLCEWIETRVNDCRWLVSETPASEIQISGTSHLIMRLLSMSTSPDIDPALRTKIDSIMFLCNFLMKEIGN